MQIARPTTRGRKTLPVVFQSQAWPSSHPVHVICNLKFFVLEIQRFTHLEITYHSHSNLLSLLALWFEVDVQCYLNDHPFIKAFFPDCTRFGLSSTFQMPLPYNFKEIGITVSNLKFPATVGMCIFDIPKRGRFQKKLGKLIKKNSFSLSVLFIFSFLFWEPFPKSE